MANMDAWKTYVHVVVIHSATGGQAQHNIHCHVVKKWSRETTTTRHEPLRALCHISKRACIVAHVVASLDYSSLCTSLPNITGRGYIHLSGDLTRLSLPYAEYTAKAVVVVGYRVGGFRSGRWCIETCINAHLCSHARPSFTFNIGEYLSVGSGLS